MAINIDYGPISNALGVAQIAGQGQGYNIQAQRDMQALQVQNQMQDTINRQQAVQMQDAIQQQNIQQQSAARQQQMAQQASYERIQQQQLAQQHQQQMAQQQAQLAATQSYQQQALAQQAQTEKDRNAIAQQNAGSLEDIRKANVAKAMRDSSAEINAPIQANGLALKSMDSQVNGLESQIKSLTAANSKEFDPNIVSDNKAQIQALQNKLDGIDPATGKKTGMGLRDKRDALIQHLQSFGDNLKPGAVMTPSPSGDGFDLNNTPDLPVPEHSELYKINAPAQPGGGTQQVSSQQGQQATPDIMVKVAQAVAAKLGATSLNDPSVVSATRQFLTQQGYTIPSIQ